MDASFIFVVLVVGGLGLAYYAQTRKREPATQSDVQRITRNLRSLNGRISDAESTIKDLRNVRSPSQQGDMSGWLAVIRERLDEIESRQRRMRSRLDAIEGRQGGTD
jgi:hypothetical protein